jgi:hypothetical protein
MLRQRLRHRTSPLAFIGRLLTLLLAAALIWYGLMTLLLALKVDPGTVNSISGHRTAFNWLAGLTPADVDSSPARPIIAGAGVLAFLIFGYLALKELPRPYLARHELALASDDRGEVVVEPRAIERIAETAAQELPAVTKATGRYGGDDVSVDLTVGRASDLAATLRDAQHRVRGALDQHDLPTVPINVTLAGFDRRQRRELH